MIAAIRANPSVLSEDHGRTFPTQLCETKDKHQITNDSYLHVHFCRRGQTYSPRRSLATLSTGTAPCVPCPRTRTSASYIRTAKRSMMGKWNEAYRLSEHNMRISAIDWSATTNKIVTCSHDRNAFVWTYDDEKGDWKQSLQSYASTAPRHTASGAQMAPNLRQRLAQRLFQSCHF